MVKNVYSIKDNKAGVFYHPIIGDDLSIRRYLHCRVNDASSIMYEFPDDFSCYEIGTYDDENGYIASCVPVLRYNLCDFIKKVEE